MMLCPLIKIFFCTILIVTAPHFVLSQNSNIISYQLDPFINDTYQKKTKEVDFYSIGITKNEILQPWRGGIVDVIQDEWVIPPDSNYFISSVSANYLNSQELLAVSYSKRRNSKELIHIKNDELIFFEILSGIYKIKQNKEKVYLFGLIGESGESVLYSYNSKQASEPVLEVSLNLPISDIAIVNNEIYIAAGDHIFAYSQKTKSYVKLANLGATIYGIEVGKNKTFLLSTEKGIIQFQVDSPEDSILFETDFFGDLTIINNKCYLNSMKPNSNSKASVISFSIF